MSEQMYCANCKCAVYGNHSCVPMGSASSPSGTIEPDQPKTQADIPEREQGAPREWFVAGGFAFKTRAEAAQGNLKFEIVQVIEKSAFDAVVLTLATERDAFGKRETELMKERDELREQVEDLKRTEQVYLMNRDWIEDAKVKIQRLESLQIDSLDDWKRIQDAERKCEWLEGELGMAKNDAKTARRLWTEEVNAFARENAELKNNLPLESLSERLRDMQSQRDELRIKFEDVCLLIQERERRVDDLIEDLKQESQWHKEARAEVTRLKHICNGTIPYQMYEDLDRYKVRIEGMILSLAKHGQNIDVEFHINWLQSTLEGRES